MSGGAPNTTQLHFRFVADDANVATSSATTLAAEDTNYSGPADTILGVRINAENTGSASSGITTIYAQRNGTGGYVQVTNASAAALGLYCPDSSNVTGSATAPATSEFILTAGTGTATVGGTYDNSDGNFDAGNGLANITAGTYRECVVMLAISSANATPGDYWDIRWYAWAGGGTAFQAYTQTPRLTYAAAGGVLPPRARLFTSKLTTPILARRN